MNIISFLDGELDLLGISEICDISYKEIVSTIDKLVDVGLVEKVSKQIN
jgi:aminopeptidase-like protein